MLSCRNYGKRDHLSCGNFNYGHFRMALWLWRLMAAMYVASKSRQPSLVSLKWYLSIVKTRAYVIAYRR